ncbi:MAG: recombinase family protein [Dethiosulfatibacter sp.]|nr:recombinase family protein [Dethiosulfatibacter sp.]
MAHTPLGYRIVNGKAVVDGEKAKQLHALFKAYIAGLALKASAESAGIMVTHSSIGRMLRNEKYLGTDFYPPIIEKATFEAAELERMKRAKALGRIYNYGDVEVTKPMKHIFKIGKIEQKYDDPFKQAEYTYSLIESEEVNE